MARRFTGWMNWTNRGSLPGLSYPGVYVLAISSTDLAGACFSWRPEIVYIGMTNAKGGLKGRLGQFDNTIKGKDGHGGAQRVRVRHPDYARLVRRLYVAVDAFPCEVASENPGDLRIMGQVAQHEYECLAMFAERFSGLPEFNDKRRSPKGRRSGIET
ncbi:MAG: hypothetical protein GXY33_21480 [Phycisphaerae bacterium]|nr:hypothetical protein [Phycisphaerae bacterium]